MTDATGVMQLMPCTAGEYGAQDPYDPEENIAAATDFIQWLDDYWSDYIDDEEQRIKFVMAFYNVEHGHVQDARRLAHAEGADPDLWRGNVETCMLKKSNQEYYNREEVRYGYASGVEPVSYVINILSLYGHYRLFVN